MSKKSTLVMTLALMGTLVVGYGSYLAAHPPKAKKQSAKIHAENSMWRLTFALTNNSTLKQLPASKR
jgi:hypothetical protein